VKEAEARVTLTSVERASEHELVHAEAVSLYFLMYASYPPGANLPSATVKKPAIKTKRPRIKMDFMINLDKYYNLVHLIRLK